MTGTLQSELYNFDVFGHVINLTSIMKLLPSPVFVLRLSNRPPGPLGQYNRHRLSNVNTRIRSGVKCQLLCP